MAAPYDPRDHGGSSSSRHHNSATMVEIAASASNTVPGESQHFGPSATELGSSHLTPTSSFKELHRQHSRSRDRATSGAFRRGSRRSGGTHFCIVRSYSMGTSQRLVPTIEFLDLEDMRCNSGRKRAAAAEKPSRLTGRTCAFRWRSTRTRTWRPQLNSALRRTRTRPGVPAWMLKRVPLYNKMVADADDKKAGRVNITRFIKDELRLSAGDAVFVKMVIEKSEWPILTRWMDDADMPAIVNELYVEVHYRHASMYEHHWARLSRGRDEATRLLAVFEMEKVLRPFLAVIAQGEGRQ